MRIPSNESVAAGIANLLPKASQSAFNYETALALDSRKIAPYCQ
jgi:hypothetical protein